MTTGNTVAPARDTPVCLTWSRVEVLTRQLAVRVHGDGMPETVVGIMRGGMIPAVMIAHQLGIRDVRTIEVTHTASDGINAAKTSAPAYKNPASLGDLAGRDVLLVDDIAGSGATLERTHRIIEALGARRLRTAVLTVNRANWRAASRPEACINYIAEQTDTWVIFPWETAEGPNAPGSSATPTALGCRVPAPGSGLVHDSDRP